MAHKGSVDIPLRVLFEGFAGGSQGKLDAIAQKLSKALSPFMETMKFNFDADSIKTLDALLEKLKSINATVQVAGKNMTIMAQNAAGITGSATITKGKSGKYTASETYSKETLTLTRELQTVYSQLEGSIRNVHNLEKQGLQSGQAYQLATRQVAEYQKQLDKLISKIQNSTASTEADKKALLADANAIMTKRNADIQLMETAHREAMTKQQQTQSAQQYLSVMNQLFSAEVRLSNLQQSGAPQTAIAAQQQLVSVLQNRAAQLKSLITDEQMLKQIEEQLTTAEAKRNAQMAQGNATIKKQQTLFGSLVSSMKMVVKTALMYNLAYTAIYKIGEAIRSVIDTVKELDKAVVNLRIVTGKSQEEAEKLLDTYTQMAQRLGSTTSEVAEAAIEWQRQGYEIEDANKLIENSMILSKVGMLESAEAQKYLTSAMKGYNMSVDESIKIVDQLTKIDMSAAVSAGGLAEAMSKTATSANLAGVEMHQLLGYLAVVGETTQKSMSSVGESKIIDALKVA